ncbi:MAG: hypothetical protein P8Y53_09715 [Pseudolabrys sp.]
MADLPADVRRHGEMALDAIEHVQSDGFARPKKQFAAAMEHLVEMRDALIRAQRQGGALRRPPARHQRHSQFHFRHRVPFRRPAMEARY